MDDRWMLKVSESEQMSIRVARLENTAGSSFIVSERTRTTYNRSYTDAVSLNSRGLLVVIFSEILKS